MVSITILMAAVYLFSLRVSVNAQDLGSLPQCAVACATTTANAVGCGGLSDTKCLCLSESFVTGAGRCAAELCSMSDEAITEQVLQSFCLLGKCI